MCTVTFLPGRKGYRLGMNRDESRERVAGLPPAKVVSNNHAFLSPSEPGGGTWICLNDARVCLALINWYAVHKRVTKGSISRGQIIRAAQASNTSVSAKAALSGMPLARINPFRLIGVFPGEKRIVEWRWNLNRLTEKRHSWTAGQWVSSGFDEPTAQKVRGAVFRAARRQATYGSADWLRRLHRSHRPEAGPLSTCMHRDDAATVSYTEVSVAGNQARMYYIDGPPCGCNFQSS